MWSLGILIRRLLTIIVGCSGLTWGFLTLPASETSDNARALESSLLRSQSFDPAGLTRTFDDWTSQDVSACDTHAQRTLLLLELPLAEAALQSGASQEFDRHIRSLEARARQVLGCAPRESFVWMLLFDLDVMHGQANEQSFGLLAMSYETSPNEAWISLRRINIALPRLLFMGDSLRDSVVSEFQQVIRNGFVEEAARSYALSSKPVQLALQSRIEQLGAPEQQAFSTALHKLQL